MTDSPRMNAGGTPLARVLVFDLATTTQQILLLQNARHAAGYAHVFVLATTVSGPVMTWKPADGAPPR